MKYLILLLLSSSLHAGDFSVDVGVSYTQTNSPPNGIWWQKPFPNRLGTDSAGFHFGGRYSFKEDLHFLLGYKYLGEFSTHALASASDANYNAFTRGKEEIWPLSTWDGEGKSQGIYALVEKDYKWLSVKAGAWVHQSPWKMVIPDWRSKRAGPSRALTVKADEDFRTGWVLGIGKKYKNWQISYEIWQVKGGREFRPSFIGRAESVVLNYNF